MSNEDVEFMWIALTVQGDAIRPSEIQAQLGVPCTAGVAKGAETRRGREAETGYYMYKEYADCSQSSDQSFTSAANRMVELFLPQVAALHSLYARPGVEVWLDAGYSFSLKQGCPTTQLKVLLSSEGMTRCAAFGLPVYVGLFVGVEDQQDIQGSAEDVDNQE